MTSMEVLVEEEPASKKRLLNKTMPMEALGRKHSAMPNDNRLFPPRFASEVEAEFKEFKSRGMDTLHRNMAIAMTILSLGWQVSHGNRALTDAAAISRQTDVQFMLWLAIYEVVARFWLVVLYGWSIVLAYRMRPSWMATYADWIFLGFGVYAVVICRLYSYGPIQS